MTENGFMQIMSLIDKKKHKKPKSCIKSLLLLPVAWLVKIPKINQKQKIYRPVSNIVVYCETPRSYCNRPTASYYYNYYTKYTL